MLCERKLGTRNLNNAGCVTQPFDSVPRPLAEVDIVVEFGPRLIPIEVKLSSTPRPAMALNIKTFQKDFGEKVVPGYILHTGDVQLPLGPGVTALPFREL